MANTVIQILRSYFTSKPPDSTLSDGELAYSFASNTLFIGNNSNGVIAIAGEGYIQNVAVLLVDGGGF
jgi:hypothetical protein